ncbi:DNA-(apurinic or apyrimidinic site) lyase [Babesia microti strain RI]|uniref:DNA-(Apurinic or apyrimidinic site) lyase n=1 Tax=Babesia microti (strain RI) TaxID=1133968 RepID=A0A1N6LWE0_BABMR|nr:DNA-(apurinic or apyrimidinic site) lyase [Babesia microti strain RI]SIO73188.1 DNA-(apurinic or apyrimidinic site) lyase [Babesia microti strain RI]|eukprot:XP_021337296.1 DNA-(apurinic or apyrimidinic site) lyase [Babesia microti strain RI]
MTNFENYPFVSVESSDRVSHSKKHVYGNVSRLLKEALDLVVYDEGKDVGTETELKLVDQETEYDPPIDLSKLIPDGMSELSYNDSLSSISSNELRLPENGYNEYLSEDDPKKIMVWDISGMHDMNKKSKAWNQFLALVNENNPCILILQNVKLCASKFTGICAKIPSKYNEGTIPPTYEQELEDGSFIDNLMKTSFKKYKVIHSLASWRVRGQMILLKKSFTPKRIRYNLNIKQNAKYHNHEGRVVIIEFDSFYLMSLITPGNGWITESIKQRKKWDLELTTFLKASKYIKAVIMVGNLNCSPEDIDVSNPAALKLEKTAVLHEEEQHGYPGTREVDRNGFEETLKAGDLWDVYRFMNPVEVEESESDSNALASTAKNPKYTSIVQTGDKCKCAVRTTLALMSTKFLRNIKSCEILGTMADLKPFGWRHLPVGLTLRVPKNKKI